MSTRHIWLAAATLAVGAWATVANAQSTVHLYIYDTHTGVVTQATGPMERDPYNASFSNNGKMLVHDLTDTVGPDFEKQLLGVTDVSTGTTTSLGLVGDDAVWSPNGQYIAYHNWDDFFASGGDPNVPILLNIVPATGGTPVTVRTWGVRVSWSNNSRRLAFALRVRVHRHGRPRRQRDEVRLRHPRQLRGLRLPSGLLTGRQADRLSALRVLLGHARPADGDPGEREGPGARRAVPDHLRRLFRR
jgi:hypothetical protein